MSESTTTVSSLKSSAATPSGPGRARLMRYLERYAFVILLLGVVAFFSTWSRTADVYPTLANLQVILAGQSVLAVVATAALIPLICNEWDLSVGASATLAAVVAAN